MVEETIYIDDDNDFCRKCSICGEIKKETNGYPDYDYFICSDECFVEACKKVARMMYG